MNEVKNHWKKWVYWFLLGVAIIVVYKALDNFEQVTGVINKFLNIIAPFFVGIFIAYLLYVPCKKIENIYLKAKNKFIKRKSRALSIITVYLIIVIILVILINVILPVVYESIVDFLSNIQLYYEMAMERYNDLPNDSILKSDIVNETIENIKHLDLKQYFNFDRTMEYLISAISAVT